MGLVVAASMKPHDRIHQSSNVLMASGCKWTFQSSCTAGSITRNAQQGSPRERVKDGDEMHWSVADRNLKVVESETSWCAEMLQNHE